MHEFEVEYRASAGEILQTLREGGMGWDSSIATYATVRQGLVAESQLWVQEVVAGTIASRPNKPSKTFLEVIADLEQPEEAEWEWDAAALAAHEKTLAAFRAQAPADDLSGLGQLLAGQWLDAGAESVVIFKDMIYDSPIEPTVSFITDIMRGAEQRGIDKFGVGRAAESFALLYRDAPMLAWPLLVCVLLHHLPEETAVSYVLTEHAHEQDVSTDEAAQEYLEDYWLGSAEHLVSQANALGKLFGVLASFDSKLGREFWFARAVDSLGRLDTMFVDKTSYTTKARGDSLESLVDALVRTEEPELSVLEKNFKTSEEEIDLVLTNSLTNPFWTALSSPLMFVECKNWSRPVGVPEIRIFESKMRDRGAVCKIGIFVAMAGFTRTALDRLKVPQRDLGVIFAITGDDLRNLVTKKTRVTEWLQTEGAIRAFGK
nr:restriction endonuclease [Arthrobacter ulcerisalmonis]